MASDNLVNEETVSKASYEYLTAYSNGDNLEGNDADSHANMVEPILGSL